MPSRIPFNAQPKAPALRFARAVTSRRLRLGVKQAHRIMPANSTQLKCTNRQTCWHVVIVLALWCHSGPLSGGDEFGDDARPAKPDYAAAEQDTKIEQLNTELSASLKKQLADIGTIDEQQPAAVDQLSRRADLQMFLGEFQKAEADYQAMVKLKPDLDASHWRLGIAMYFSGHPEQAAAQFDRYNSFDNVDRENGIWRYLSHRTAFGKEKAQEQLLKYEKDDRPPFKEVYRLFDGSLTAPEVLASISADLPEDTRNSRLFYAHLYIGLNCAAENDRDEALASLRLATLNPWPRKAGFGPDYMWHIGRLRYIQRKAEPATP